MHKGPYFEVIGSVPFWFWHITAMSEITENTAQTSFLAEICIMGHILKSSDWYRFDSDILRQRRKQVESPPKHHFWPKYTTSEPKYAGSEPIWFWYITAVIRLQEALLGHHIWSNCVQRFSFISNLNCTIYILVHYGIDRTNRNTSFQVEICSHTQFEVIGSAPFSDWHII